MFGSTNNDYNDAWVEEKINKYTAAYRIQNRSNPSVYDLDRVRYVIDELRIQNIEPRVTSDYEIKMKMKVLRGFIDNYLTTWAPVDYEFERMSSKHRKKTNDDIKVYNYLVQNKIKKIPDCVNRSVTRMENGFFVCDPPLIGLNNVVYSVHGWIRNTIRNNLDDIEKIPKNQLREYISTLDYIPLDGIREVCLSCGHILKETLYSELLIEFYFDCKEKTYLIFSCGGPNNNIGLCPPCQYFSDYKTKFSHRNFK